MTYYEAFRIDYEKAREALACSCADPFFHWKMVLRTGYFELCADPLLKVMLLSYDLLGSIDEVDQVVHITWVQPRVLDLNQVTANFFQLAIVLSWCPRL